MMELERFWNVIEESRRSPDQDERLGELLEELTPEEVAAFDERFRACHAQLNRWDLWGAGYLLEGGMSDDGFIDFRSFVISRGRRDFELALSDPESFALSVIGLSEEDRSREEFSYIAAEVYEDLTDEELPESSLEYDEFSSEPAGDQWQDEDDLEARFPRLAARA